VDKWETKEKDDRKNLQYYYKREERLDRAGPYARFAESLHNRKRPGLLKTMTATRSLSFLFFTLTLIVVGSLIVNWVSGSRDKAAMGGYSYSLDALWFEGDVYLTVLRERGRGAEIPGTVELSLTVGDAVANAIMVPGQNEVKLRLSAPTKPDWSAAVLSLGNESAQLAARVR
jgi:hypothetical protein